MRLIDADALIQKESVMRKGCAYIEEINNAPTIDAEPVLHCKDCEYWDEEDHGCNIRDSYGWDYKPDDFCSYGKRREP